MKMANESAPLSLDDLSSSLLLSFLRDVCQHLLSLQVGVLHRHKAIVKRLGLRRDSRHVTKLTKFGTRSQVPMECLLQQDGKTKLAPQQRDVSTPLGNHVSQGSAGCLARSLDTKLKANCDTS
jgi:hypothetical protein